jgi:hypothetical protein
VSSPRVRTRNVSLLIFSRDSEFHFLPLFAAPGGRTSRATCALFCALTTSHFSTSRVTPISIFYVYAGVASVILNESASATDRAHSCLVSLVPSTLTTLTFVHTHNTHFPPHSQHSLSILIRDCTRLCRGRQRHSERERFGDRPGAFAEETSACGGGIPQTKQLLRSRSHCQRFVIDTGGAARVCVGALTLAAVKDSLPLSLLPITHSVFIPSFLSSFLPSFLSSFSTSLCRTRWAHVTRNVRACQVLLAFVFATNHLL